MRTETYALTDERDRLDAALDDLADQAAAGGLSDADQARVQRLERQYRGVLWALNPDAHESRDPYESVTLRELTAGQYIKAGDQAREDSTSVDAPVGADTERLYRVAHAVVDADFVPDPGGFDDTLIAVGQLKPQFFFWLEQRVDDLTSPDVEGNGFAQRVAARRSDGTPTSNSLE